MVFAMVNTYHVVNKCFDGTLNSLHSMAFIAEKENNESYTFQEMLKQPDAVDFIEAMQKEVNDHKTRDHWEVVPCWEKPPDIKTIMSIW